MVVVGFVVGGLKVVAVLEIDLAVVVVGPAETAPGAGVSPVRGP